MGTHAPNRYVHLAWRPNIDTHIAASRKAPVVTTADTPATPAGQTGQAGQAGQTATEIWRNLPDYIGTYQVSDQGRVRSLTRTVTDKNGRSMTLRGKVITPALAGKSGYYQFAASENGLQRRITVQAAVLAAFVGPPPEGAIVLHLNGNPRDNRLVNLRYGTRAEVSQMSRLRGTMKGLSTTQCPRGHALAEPNLVTSQLARGYRQCKACHRAQSKLKVRGLGPEHLQAVADECYARILAGDPPLQRNTHCTRGHRLEEPNLVRGRRGCLSCNRAQAYLARHPERNTPEEIQTAADGYYARLNMPPVGHRPPRAL